MVIYQFCAMRQQPDKSLSYFDGIMGTPGEITTKEQYIGLKNDVAKHMANAEKGEDVILLSLSKIS